MILLSLFLLAPDAKRLANFFLRDRPAPSSSDRPLFLSKRKNRIAFAVQVLAGVFLIGANLYGSVSAGKVYGPERPKSPLYGIWNVENFSFDGHTRPPLFTDASRWRWIVFDSPQYVTFYEMDDHKQSYRSNFDLNARSLALSKSPGQTWKADFSFTRPDSTHLFLDGVMDGHKIHAECELVDRSKFLLVNRGFHWVQDYPFNR